jgi:hypothetical protein
MLVTVSMLSKDSISVSSSLKLLASESKCFFKSLLLSADPSRTSVKSSFSPSDSRVAKSMDCPSIACVLFLAISELDTLEANIRAAVRCMCSG